MPFSFRDFESVAETTVVESTDSKARLKRIIEKGEDKDAISASVALARLEQMSPAVRKESKLEQVMNKIDILIENGFMLDDDANIVKAKAI